MNDLQQLLAPNQPALQPPEVQAVGESEQENLPSQNQMLMQQFRDLLNELGAGDMDDDLERAMALSIQDQHAQHGGGDHVNESNNANNPDN